jgi:hypothetical protein
MAWVRSWPGLTKQAPSACRRVLDERIDVETFVDPLAILLSPSAASRLTMRIISQAFETRAARLRQLLEPTLSNQPQLDVLC